MEYHHTLREGTKLIDEYRIVRVLGSGGFANTYLAADESLEREVAIKEYFPNDIAYREGATTVRVKGTTFKSNFDWGLDRFVREARTLAKFRHPNIVRVFRIFDANSTAYIVLDFVRGADMEAWLRGLGRPATQAELDVLAAPLLDALDLVHSEKILHRDIKPQNIYIRDEDRAPVLLDFGAARFSVGELTGTTAAIVSRGFSPHEAYATDPKLQGPWTDIYGMAATFYRAISGKEPPEATGRVLDDTLVPAASLPNKSSYRPEFLAAIDWGLSVMPKTRPQSAKDWRDRLMTGAATQPVTGVTAPATFFPTAPVPPQSSPALPPLSGRGVKSEPAPKSRSASAPHDTQKSGRGSFYAGAGLMVASLALLGVWGSGLMDDAPRTSQTVADVSGGAASAQRDADERTRREAAAQAEREAAAAKTQQEADERTRREAAARAEREAAAAKAQQDADERTRREAAAQAEREAAAAKAQQEADERTRREAAAQAEREAVAAKAQQEADERTRREAAAQAEREAAAAKAQQEADERTRREAAAQAEREAAAAKAQQEADERTRREAEAKAKAEREAAAAKEQQVAANTLTEPVPPPPPGGLQADRRAELVKQLQRELKDRSCYTGDVNGEVPDGETALRGMTPSLSRAGEDARSIVLADASAKDFEDWFDWLKTLDDFDCKPKSSPKPEPEARPKRQRERAREPERPRRQQQPSPPPRRSSPPPPAPRRTAPPAPAPSRSDPFKPSR